MCLDLVITIRSKTLMFGSVNDKPLLELRLIQITNAKNIFTISNNKTPSIKKDPITLGLRREIKWKARQSHK